MRLTDALLMRLVGPLCYQRTRSSNTSYSRGIMNSIFVVSLLAVSLQLSYGVTAPKIKLNDGHEIPSLALGTWLGNNTQGRVDPAGDEVEKAVATAIDLGYRHIDTAWAYKVEDQVGRAVNAKIKAGVNRGDLFITTKLWNEFHARDAVVPALQKSLDKLQLNYVDLYLIHWPIGQFANQTYDDTDYAETWRGMVEARRRGLARSVGVSNFNQDQIQRLLRLGLEAPAVNQVEINLNLQQPDLLAYCRQQGIVVMGYTPFGSLLPSKARPDAPPPRVDSSELLGAAQKYNKTVTQLTLRYLMDLGVIPIPKALKSHHIAQNFDIFDFTISEDDRELLRSYDKGYRTIPQLKWLDHPYYPFEKN